MSDAPLYMIRAELDRARLFQLARHRHLPVRDVDLGYLIHSALRSSFGEYAPQPFSFNDGRRCLTVLGYGDHPAEFLIEHCQRFADPLAWSVCSPEGLVSKSMPPSLTPGTQLGFAIRICPVVRKASAGDKHRKGAEVDAFLSRCWDAGDDDSIDREAVYREWLVKRLAANGAARVGSVSMVRFRRERVVRSTHAKGDGPQVHHCERPDAYFRGTLEVEASDAFLQHLRRGIGRHRAFGFGMLLLQPIRRAVC
jgi:CRISPR system Cascade subunit CasE